MTRPAFRRCMPQVALAAACLLLLRPDAGLAADVERLRLGACVRITTRAADPRGVVVLDSSEPWRRASAARRPSPPSRHASETVVGELTAIGRSVLVVEASGERLAVQRDAIKWMEIKEGGASKTKGALTGGAVGLAIALAFTIAVDPHGACLGHSRYCAKPFLTRQQAAVGATAVLVPLGSGLGALVAPGERWVGVNPATPATQAGPGNGGVHVSFTFAF